MAKSEYTAPELEIIGFESEDIITTSGLSDDDYETDFMPD